MVINPSRALCGLATAYDQRRRDTGQSWSAEQFGAFLELQIGIPLRVDHGPLVNSRSVIANIGVVRRFASVTLPVPGLLILAEIHEAEGYGTQLLSDLTLMCQQVWLPPSWGLSVGALVTEDMVVPHEISVTNHPAFPDARIFGVREEAIALWELLTEQQVAV